MGHRLVQGGGNLLIDLGGEVHGTGQGRQGHHLDAQIQGLFADELGDLVMPLGQHVGGLGLFQVVLEGDGEVQRVGDHHVRYTSPSPPSTTDRKRTRLNSSHVKNSY